MNIYTWLRTRTNKRWELKHDVVMNINDLTLAQNSNRRKWRLREISNIVWSLKYAAQRLKIDDFKDLQASAIYSVVLSGEDVFVSLPTGFWKSAIYQALPCIVFWLPSNSFSDRAKLNAPEASAASCLREDPSILLHAVFCYMASATSNYFEAGTTC